jgi:predicted MFS family arabinose efflux permease
VYTVGPSIALIISPAIGGFMADWISLRSVFLAAAVCQIVAVFFFARIRPREEAPRHERPAPASYRQALGYRPIAVLCLLQFTILLTLTIGFALSPNYLEDVKGLSVGTIGRFGSLIAVCSVLIGILVAKVRYFANPLNALLLAISLCPLSYVLLLGGSMTWHFALAYFLRGGYMVGWGLFYPALGEVTPERLRTRAFALTELLGGFGFAIAPFIAGALFTVDPALPIVVSLVASFPLLLMIWIVRRYIAGHRLSTA